MSLCFAYGANMDRDHMARTAPTARRLGVATLGNHRIAIAIAGYGTLVAAPGARVHGLLWDLKPSDEAALDLFEGVPRGFYRKAELEVTDGSGERHRAMIYLAADERPGRAHPAYLAQVAAAAEALGFPADYLAEVASLPVTAAESAPWVPPSERPIRPKA